MQTAADVLSHVQEQDQFNLGVHTLLSASTLYQRLLSVWPNVARLLPADRTPTEPIPDGLPAEYRLRWLWARIEPDPGPLWLKTAGLPPAEHNERAVEVMQDNAVVFPDGTMSKWANQWLKQKAGVKEEAEADALSCLHQRSMNRMYDLIVRLAERRKGITVPELVDRFHIPRLLAWRALQRLEKFGRIHKTTVKRRRDIIYYNAGRGSDVYKAHPNQEEKRR